MRRNKKTENKIKFDYKYCYNNLRFASWHLKKTKKKIGRLANARSFMMKDKRDIFILIEERWIDR